MWIVCINTGNVAEFLEILSTISNYINYTRTHSWWRHQIETFSALLTICAGNSPATGEFPAQRPLTRSFGTCFDLRPNKRLSKHCWGWWFETPPRPLWRHCNVDDQRNWEDNMSTFNADGLTPLCASAPAGHSDDKFGPLYMPHRQLNG